MPSYSEPRIRGYLSPSFPRRMLFVPPGAAMMAYPIVTDMPQVVVYGLATVWLAPVLWCTTKCGMFITEDGLVEREWFRQRLTPYDALDNVSVESDEQRCWLVLHSVDEPYGRRAPVMGRRGHYDSPEDLRQFADDLLERIQAAKAQSTNP